MQSDKEKLIDVVVKLNNLTQDGKLKWDAVKPRESLNRGSESIVDLFYTTRYKSKRLGLYEKKFRVEAPSTSSLSASLSGLKDYLGITYPYWGATVILEIIDEYENCLWTFPSVQGLHDLISTVKFKSSGASEFIDSVLSDS